MKPELGIVLLLYTCLLCSCWFDFRNEIWELDPVYVSADSLAFEGNKDNLQFYITNPGPHSEISYSVDSDLDWLTVSPSEGKVSKNNDAPVTVMVNRSLLEEGRNAGSLTVSVGGREYTKSISAVGLAELHVSPDSLDFGASLSSKTISVYSRTGNLRTFVFSSNDNWISIDPKRCVLSENPDGREELSKQIAINCDRSELETGTHEGTFSIQSGKGTYSSEYKVIITIPEQGEYTQQIGDYIFTVSNIYRGSDGSVNIDLTIENASTIYRTFKLNSSSSFAADTEGNRYSVYADSVNIKKKTSAIMKLRIYDVPDDVTQFASLELDFSLMELLIIKNISL